MKRYSLEMECDDDGDVSGAMVESENGQWCRYDDSSPAGQLHERLGPAPRLPDWDERTSVIAKIADLAQNKGRRPRHVKEPARAGDADGKEKP